VQISLLTFSIRGNRDVIRLYSLTTPLTSYSSDHLPFPPPDNPGLRPCPPALSATQSEHFSSPAPGFIFHSIISKLSSFLSPRRHHCHPALPDGHKKSRLNHRFKPAFSGVYLLPELIRLHTLASPSSGCTAPWSTYNRGSFYSQGS
jgi:hypothetical protein